MDATAVTALATFFTALDGWSVGTVLLVVFLVPPFLGLVAVLKAVTALSTLKTEIMAKNIEDNKRFESIVAMFNQQMGELVNKYDNNVYLVKSWEKVAGDMTTMVHLNTQAMTSLGNKFDQMIAILNADRK